MSLIEQLDNKPTLGKLTDAGKHRQLDLGTIRFTRLDHKFLLEEKWYLQLIQKKEIKNDNN